MPNSRALLAAANRKFTPAPTTIVETPRLLRREIPLEGAVCGTHILYPGAPATSPS